jgi:hypothetical protein
MMKPRNGIYLLIFCSLLSFSCRKKISGKDIQESLKTAMSTYLNHQPRIDTTQLKFKVLEVIYFEDKTFYRCEFKVNMKQNLNGQLKDTTGMMAANITKDFKDITRKY